MNKKLMYLVLGCLLGLITFTFVFRMLFLNSFTPDSYLHMGIGQYIITFRSIPSHQDVSFKVTNPSIEFITHSWLSDVLIYLAGSVGEIFSLLILLIPLLILTLAVAHKVLNLFKIDLKLQLVLLAIALFIAVPFWKLHPFVFLTPLTLSLSFIYFSWVNKRSHLIFLIPVIFLLAANFAGGFYFVPVILALSMIVFELIVFLTSFITKNQFPKRMFWLILTLVVSIPIGLILNPLGPRIGLYPLTFMGVMGLKRWSGSVPELLSILNQNFIKEQISSTVLICFVLYALLSIGLFIVISIRSKEFIKKSFRVIPLFPFFILGMIWIRFIPVTVFVTLPIFGVSLAYLIKHMPIKKTLPFQFVLLVLIGIMLVFTIFTPRMFDFSPPKKTVDIFLENDLKANTLTSFEYSGYVFYRNFPHKGLLDARDDIYDESEMINIYGEVPRMTYDDLSPILVENDAATAVLSRKSGFPLAAALSQSELWKLVYFDKDSYLFVDSSTVTPDFLASNTLQYVDFSKSLGFDVKNMDQAIKEMEQFTKKYPQNYYALGQLASMYRFTKQFGKAEQILNQIPESQRDFLYLTEQGKLAAAQGKCQDSEMWYKKALSLRNEQYYSRAVLDMAVLYIGCFNDREKAKHYFLRYNSFLLSDTEKAKMKKLMDDFGINLEE